MRFNTVLIHGKQKRAYAAGATLPQISQTNAFTYESAEDQERVFSHRASGFAYSRIGNPTIAAFEQRISEIEGGSAAVACSSGMSAITLSLLNILCAGDEIIVGSGLYGGSIDLFRDLQRLGIRTRFVRHMTPREIQPLLNEKTRTIYGEVISNPGLEVMDVKAVAETAHAHGLPLIVDNTVAIPFLVNPILLGADIVVHSTSKYIDGGGNAIGGVIIDSCRFQWDVTRHRALEGFERYGALAYTIRLRTDLWENMGNCMSPFNAFLTTVGLETLGLRMERICQNAQALAEALSAVGGIAVNYPGLPGSGSRDLVQRQLKGYGGGILTVRTGSKERAYDIINNLSFAKIASNIGDVRTLVIHPASTLFRHSNEQELEAAGVYEDLIRVSVGIEDIDDLTEDFIKTIEKR